MPELPEVEVCRQGVLPGVVNQTILSAVVRVPRLRRGIPADLPQTLAGRTVTEVLRRGKYLLFHCRRGAEGGWLVVHLGMTGNLYFAALQTPPQQHDHLDLVFKNHLLRYRDPRRFGVVDWLAEEDWRASPLLAGLGMEPLGDGFTGGWLFEATRNRRGPIKPILMDARLVVGIGNIYASESLFRAGISPLRPAGRISRARHERLAAAIRQTLQDAIAAGGSTIRDYQHSDGGSGYFQLSCAVYDREGAPCPRCGSAIRKTRQGGRSSFYCPRCQR